MGAKMSGLFFSIFFVKAREQETDKSQRDGALPAVASEKPFCPPFIELLQLLPLKHA